MAVAEEERRRKALEERRKAQREATNRFKTAMSKMRTAKTPATSAVHRNENLREESKEKHSVNTHCTCIATSLCMYM